MTVTFSPAMLIGSETVVELGATLFGIPGGTVRTQVTPPGFRGRVAAAARTVSLGSGVVGGLAGGLLGSVIGLWGTVVVAGAGTLLSLAWLVRSPE